MPQITYTATLGGVDDTYTTGVTDLDIRTGAGGPVLYTATRAGTGVSAWDIGATGPAQLIDQQAMTPGTGLVATVQLELVPLGGADYAVTLGPAGPVLSALTLDEAGAITGTASFVGGTGFQGDLVRLISAQIDGTTYIYAAHRGQGGVTTYVLDETHQLTLSANGEASTDPVTQGEEISAFLRVETGADTFLLATHPALDGVVSYRLGADGLPRAVDSLGAADGLGVATPTALAQATAWGRTFVVMGAAGSSSLTVMELGADGQLTPLDHIIDTRDTRFQGITTLEVVTLGERVFVMAGGADDGFSLFELLPGGRLYHLGSVADTAALTLNNVTALAATAQDGAIQLFASSETEAGISQFTIDPGPLGQTLIGTGADETLSGGALNDLIAGGAGDDTLRGGAGDDIMMDGTGADTLTGGAGADVFVLSADGQADTITDFDPAQDTLDLSGFTLLRSSAQVQVSTTSWGATLTYGNEVIHLYTADGSPLSVFDIAALDLVNVDRLPLGNLGTGLLVEGGGGNNRLEGAASDDTLNGGAGDDTLTGGAGADRLIGGAGEDAASYAGASAGVVADLATPQNNTGDAAGDSYDGIEDLIGTAYADTLSGDTGRNRVWGGHGGDVITGGGGDDRLRGEGGSDLIEGGTGHDRIWAGTGYDTVRGGDGDDTIYGGRSGDTLMGGAGADRLFGGKGKDFVSYADAPRGITLDLANPALNTGDAAGDSFTAVENFEGSAYGDLMRGDSTRDRLFGGAGNDTLAGRGDNDKLVGGDGKDLLKGDDGRDHLKGDDGNDTLKGGAGDDTLEGGTGGDVLRGEGGRDLIQGQAGNDGLTGGDGADTLMGGNGRDNLAGEAGNDLLTGGADADTFVYAPGDGVDTITDFELGLDALKLDDALWSGTLTRAEVVETFGRVQNGKIVLDFGTDASVVLEGITDLDALVDDLVII